MPQSISELGRPGNNRLKLIRWGQRGAVAGTIAALLMFCIAVPTWAEISADPVTIESYAMLMMAPIGWLLLLAMLMVLAGVSFLGGVVGGAILSRLRPGLGALGALMGGVITGIAPFSPTLISVADSAPILFLPEHRLVVYAGGGTIGTWAYIRVDNDFSEDDAIKLGDYYEKWFQKQFDASTVWPLTIGFFCRDVPSDVLEGGGHSERSLYLLYEYKKLSNNAPPSVSTPQNPSWPGQGTACK